jgi:ATP-dependent RNA helicase DeaD
VANEAGIDGNMIGAIRIEDSYSTIDLPVGMSDSTFQTLKRARIGGKPMNLSNDRGSSGDSFRPGRNRPFRNDNKPREFTGNDKSGFTRGKKPFRDAKYKKSRAQA